MKLKKSVKRFVTAALLLALIAVVIIALGIFHNKISSILRQSSLRNISEIQHLYTSFAQEKFADQFAMLEGQARYFDNVDLQDDQALRQTILATKGIGSFKRIAVVNAAGMATNRTGLALPNIYNKRYFQSAMASGQPQISNLIEADETLEPILTLAQPIMRNKKAQALIIGTLSYSVLKDLFSASMFDGQSYFYLIANDGNIILCNKDKRKMLYNVNFYEYVQSQSDKNDAAIEKMKNDITYHQADNCLFDGVEGEKIFAYAPLGINDWYMVTVVPISYIAQQQVSINKIVFTLVGIISCVIVLFLTILFALSKKNDSIEKDNERLTIANDKNQSLIFEYDFQKQLVTFSGNTQFMLNTDRKQFPIDLIKTEYVKRIYVDDRNIVTHLCNSIRKGEEDFVAEFRYKVADSSYIWLRMTGSLIFGGEKDGKREAQKFIGSILNVNEQLLYEQELKTMADTDRLSGLLNKSALERKIKAYLAEEAGETPCALFIVDLDNFKQVNDTLGHMIGDMAIVDTAKKLSLIFSEKDFIGRFGGDEFCILLRLPETFGKDAQQKIIADKARNICQLLKESYFDDKNAVQVSASVGIALYPEDGTGYEALFARADEAVYAVKEHGKNGFQFYKNLSE